MAQNLPYMNKSYEYLPNKLQSSYYNNRFGIYNIIFTVVYQTPDGKVSTKIVSDNEIFNPKTLLKENPIWIVINRQEISNLGVSETDLYKEELNEHFTQFYTI